MSVPIVRPRGIGCTIKPLSPRRRQAYSAEAAAKAGSGLGASVKYRGGPERSRRVFRKTGFRKSAITPYAYAAGGPARPGPAAKVSPARGVYNMVS